MSEDIRYVHRTCPCFSGDVEGIQTWLEDLAAEGLLLEGDGAFLGIYSFRKTTPCHARYRLVPMREPRGFFSDEGDGPSAEEEEDCAAYGWEYLLRCGQFHVYRAMDPNARPLHTDPVVHALAMKAVKNRQLRTLLFELLYLTAIFAFRHFSLFSPFLLTALGGPVLSGAVLGLLLWAFGKLTADWVRLNRYQKRLQAGDSLESPKPWREKAWKVRLMKLLPAALTLALLISGGIALHRAGQSIPLEQYEGNRAFAALADVFPEGELDHQKFGDYNTVTAYDTAFSSNCEWNELAYVKEDGRSRHCILRLSSHVTAGEWLAKGLFEDYYRSEATRYRGKRFEDLQAPETNLDAVRVFSSYGVFHVLVRQDNVIVHAVVTIEDLEQQQRNRWDLWLTAMETYLQET